MEEKLLDEILEQLNNQGKIDISILIILGILFFVFVVKQLAEIFFTRQATKNEKKGDEELYISQKQYETETMIFLEFSERRYSICTKINSISKEKGSINVSKKDNYEKIYEELVKEYGAEGLKACPMLKAGQVFYADYAKPEGFCDEAWKAIYQYVFALSHGAGETLFYYGDWIRKPGVAICSCNDGLRPVIFKLEATEEESVIDYTPVR